MVCILRWPAATQRQQRRRLAEPSWARVLATTIKLATSRRLRSPGFGHPATAGQQGRNWFRWGRRHLRQLAARRWRLTGLLLLALAVVASGAVQFTGVIAGTASPAARTPASGNPPAGSADPAGGPAMSALAAGVAVRSDFAAPSPLGCSHRSWKPIFSPRQRATANRWCVRWGGHKSDER